MPNCSTAPAPYCGRRIRRELPRRAEARTIGRSAHQRAAAKLDSGKHLRGARIADARHVMQLAERGASQSVQPARAFQQPVRQLEGAAFAATRFQNDRDEFVVTERRRAETLQFFAWPIVRCDILHFDILNLS